MLIIELDLARVTASQRGYRQQGTMHGVALARQVSVLRMALEERIRRFLQGQRKAAGQGDSLLDDGTQSTLMDQVLLPTGSRAWPKRAAAILHGLNLPVAPLLPVLPCCPNGPDLRALDSETYLTRLDDGPPQAREFGDMTALALYFAPLRTMCILWIGAEADPDSAKQDLESETADWTDWTGVCPPYAHWLAAACQRHLPDQS